VRAVRGSGAQRVESESSGRACAIPVDTEPPAMVTHLLATPEEGRIVLRWDPNGEEDLQGYIVLRSAAGDDTLQQLTTTPIARTGFTDDTVMPGQTYTYVVHAVDSRIPVPNRSDPAETTATAR
jgi:fibronectin type 3 domain-containing protein